MNKKGQVTIFIILGILILIFITLILFLSSNKTESLKEQIDYTDTASVKLFVDSCLSNTLEQAIFDISQKGGYYNLPELSTTDAYVNTAYYLYLGELYLPTEEIIIESLENYVNDNLVSCTNFSYFPGMQVTLGDVSTAIILSEEQVTASVNFPLIIIPEEGTQIELNNFESTVDSRILILFNIAKEVSENQEEYGEMVCISCLALLGYEYGLEILTVDGDEGTLFSLFDLESDIKNSESDDLSFRFIHKYYDETISEEICENSKVNIEFTRLENIGYGDSVREVYVGPYADQYLEGEEIPLDEIDDGLITNVPGLSLERGAGYLRFVLQGYQTGDDLEIVDFLVYVENAIVTSIESDEDYPLESQGDESHSDDANQDEVYIGEDGNFVAAYLRVSSQNDGFYMYYNCLEEEEVEG